MRDVARYVALPGIVPRLKDFAASGFASLAQLMALVYASVRLLPPHHPYLNAANYGRFGIRHVIAEAARHIEFKKENTDQIVIFFAVAGGLILLFGQFALLVLALFINPVFAGPPAITNYFAVPTAVNDIAYMLLDLVFGVPNIFRGVDNLPTCVAAGAPCLGGGTAGVWPSPFHIALQTMFRFYNTAILLIGALIFLYYVLIVVGETAMTGTPFGKRFDHIWAPLRLVTALGLLIPLNLGLNTAQYIVLYSAKFGSAFATNGWHTYINWVEASMSGPVSPDTNVTGIRETASSAVTPVGVLGPTNPMIAPPPYQAALEQVEGIFQFMSIARACKVAHETIYSDRNGGLGMTIEPWLVSRPFNAVGPLTPGAPIWGDPTAADPRVAGSAMQFYNGGDIIIRFGENGAGAGPGGGQLYPKEVGGVFPYCGEITIHTPDMKYQGAKEMQRAYYNWVVSLWTNPEIVNFGLRAACLYVPDKNAVQPLGACAATPFPAPDNVNELPNATWKQNTVASFRTGTFLQVFFAYASMQAVQTSLGTATSPTGIRDRGWGGAGIWYNTIAEMNGAFQGSVRQVPTPTLMPAVMRDVQESLRGKNQNTKAEDRYCPKFGEGSMSVNFTQKGDMAIAQMLCNTYKYFRKSHSTAQSEARKDSNPIFTVMNAIFGTDGLMDMRKVDNIHPLAQLSALGKGIMDSTIRNLMTALAFSMAGGATEALDGALGGALLTASSAIISVATLGLTIGFTLYYVLPFLPFIYFFFAVGAWVKTVFEAMVGAPLWALAHLRIDGEGLPGQAAMNGYYLVFEIFARPILTVFGLLAGMIAFTAMAKTLNGLFPLIVSNTSGYDDTAAVSIILDLQFKRSILDEFFYTLVYTILVYLMAVSSFKMIDQVPANFMRWMGAGVRPFSDHHQDAAQELSTYASIGANTVGSQVTGALQSASQTFGYTVGKGSVGLADALTKGRSATKIVGK